MILFHDLREEGVQRRQTYIRVVFTVEMALVPFRLIAS